MSWLFFLRRSFIMLLTKDLILSFSTTIIRKRMNRKNKLRFSFLILALCLLQLLVLVQPYVAAEGQVTFSDEFNGSSIDSSKWAVQLNTNNSGNPVFGGNVQVMNGRVYLSSTGTGFPYVTAVTNPFPETGDFEVQFSLNYAYLRDLGNGLWITKGPFHIHQMGEWANVLQIWADDLKFGIVAFLLGNMTVVTPPPATDLTGKDLNFILDYISGQYSLYLNGNLIANASSDIRPDTIGFGHEPADYIPFGPPGSPGILDNWDHLSIDYIRVDNIQPLKTSSISIVTDAESAPIGYTIKANGQLMDENGEPLSERTVFLSYAIPGLPNWNIFSSVKTSQDGSYSAAWLPTGTGNFMMKASWNGDESYKGAEVTKNISVTQNEVNSLFYAESNSTLSSLYFNSTSSEISFTVSGSPDTTGYVRFLISKTVITDATAIQVYMDGQQISCNVSSLNNSWELYFSYHHSIHDVVINVPKPETTPSNLPPTQSAGSQNVALFNLDWVKVAILVFMGIVVAVTIVVASISMSKKSHTRL
jgi:hypothetical protein